MACNWTTEMQRHVDPRLLEAAETDPILAYCQSPPTVPAQIDDYFYQSNKSENRSLYVSMLERKRDDIVRSVVLQMHTAIEDILTSYIETVVLRVKPDERRKASRTSAGKALRKLLHGAGSIGFDLKLSLRVSLGILNSKTARTLSDLNTLRNKFSHNWLLRALVRRGKRQKQKKPPLLLYNGRDLHSVPILKDFVSDYAGIYLRLFGKKYA